MKRKTKSAILRAELLQKAADAVKTSTKKIPAPTIPLRTRGMPRKMTDTSTDADTFFCLIVELNFSLIWELIYAL